MYSSDFSDILDTFFNNRGRSNFNYSTSVLKNNSEDNYEVNQTKDGAYLFFEAPGFNKTNLKVEIDGGVMSIQGKRTYKMNGEEFTKSIDKQFKLGSTYNAELIEATIEDGLLTVFIPNFKKQEKKTINLL